MITEQAAAVLEYMEKVQTVQLESNALKMVEVVPVAVMEAHIIMGAHMEAAVVVMKVQPPLLVMAVLVVLSGLFGDKVERSRQQ
jgi:cytochrome c oxidase assembly factor CtaG